jgi:bifunctional DNA-binding transcriptional regulator/antitoxin component of YhaV-PrlF toxin-antitoxin module
MIRSTLTDRWQTTIPAEVREALGLKPRQGLLYELRGESVVIRPEGESLMDLAGCLKTDQPAGTEEQDQQAAQRFVADNYKATGG